MSTLLSLFSLPGTVLDTATAATITLVTNTATILEPIAGEQATAAAVVLIAALVRFTVLPLSYLRLRAARGQAGLTARIGEIQERYQGQPGRLRRELAEPLRLRRRGLAVSMVPMAIQLPFFVVFYRACSAAAVAGQPNPLLAHHILGTPLGHQWLLGLAEFGLLTPATVVLAVLVGLLALTAWWSTRLTDRDPTMAGSMSVPGATEPAELATARAQVARFVRLVPYGTVAVAAFVPLAAGLYLLVSAAWSNMERWTFGPRHAGPAAA